MAADWTVMVYLAGDNNLTAECIYALTEMKKVELGSQVNVIVQFDPQDEYLPTRRFKITHDPSPGKLLNDDKEGSPFKESVNARRRERAHAAALKAGKTAVSAAALKSLEYEHVTASTNPFSVTAKKALGKNIEIELLGDVAQSNGIETDTGSPVTLYNFMSYCVEKFKADHYMVVLSGHGSGTERDFLLKDESPVGSLTLNELKQAFQDLKPELGKDQVIDILGLDACLMSMAEVCYELKDFVGILIGSEGYSPASGWPYREVLGRLVQETINGGNDIQDRVAKGIVEEYLNFYTDYWLGGLSVDQSALNLKHMEDEEKKEKKLKGHIDALAEALISELTPSKNYNDPICQALILAHWATQSYNGEQFIDIVDFCENLKRRYTANGIPKLCEDLSLFIRQNFVLKTCYNGPTYQYSYGVSIYFPWARVAPSYKELSFAKKSSWAMFLDIYIAKTRREPRIDEAQRKLLALLDPHAEGDLEQAGEQMLLSSNSTFTPQPFRQTQGKGPGSGNAIYSMRNPPIFAIPDDCVKEKEKESMLKSFKKILVRSTSKKTAS